MNSALDKKNTLFYYIASGKTIENDFGNTKPIPFFIIIGFCGMILIFTQYKIEKFNKSVDSQQQQLDVQVMEEAGDQEIQNFSSDKYSKNTYRIVLLILFVFFTSFALYILLTPWIHFYDVRLRQTSLRYLILHNVIPTIFIVRNDTLFCFMKIQILKILKCKCRNNNQIEPMIELHVL